MLETTEMRVRSGVPALLDHILQVTGLQYIDIRQWMVFNVHNLRKMDNHNFRFQRSCFIVVLSKQLKWLVSIVFRGRQSLCILLLLVVTGDFKKTSLTKYKKMWPLEKSMVVFGGPYSVINEYWVFVYSHTADSSTLGWIWQMRIICIRSSPWGQYKMTARAEKGSRIHWRSFRFFLFFLGGGEVPWLIEHGGHSQTPRHLSGVWVHVCVLSIASAGSILCLFLFLHKRMKSWIDICICWHYSRAFTISWAIFGALVRASADLHFATFPHVLDWYWTSFFHAFICPGTGTPRHI